MMRRKITTIGIVLLVLIASALLLIPRKKESFVDIDTTLALPSSRTLFRSAKSNVDYDKSYKDMFNTLNDRDDLLHVHRCYQLPPHAAGSLVREMVMRNKIATQHFKIMTSSFAHIRERIVASILQFKERMGSNGAAGPLKGPVYAFISQAPYYVDDKGRPMTIQYHINEYIFKPHNILNSNASQAVMVHVTLIFPGYTMTMNPNPMERRTPRITARAQALPIGNANVYGRALKTFESRNNKCFIECIQESITYCGCATGKTPYQSTCLGPSAKKKYQEEPATFAMLYKINPQYGRLLESKIFDNVM